jgi:hypothetical protein
MRPRVRFCRITRATKESERANSLSECQSKPVRCPPGYGARMKSDGSSGAIGEVCL